MHSCHITKMLSSSPFLSLRYSGSTRITPSVAEVNMMYVSVLSLLHLNSIELFIWNHWPTGSTWSRWSTKSLFPKYTVSCENRPGFNYNLWKPKLWQWYTKIIPCNLDWTSWIPFGIRDMTAWIIRHYQSWSFVNVGGNILKWSRWQEQTNGGKQQMVCWEN